MIQIAKKYDRFEVLSFINGYWRDNCIAPTVREIAAHFGMALSTAAYILRDLKEEGYIEIKKESARGIVPAWVKESIKKGGKDVDWKFDV